MKKIYFKLGIIIGCVCFLIINSKTKFDDIIINSKEKETVEVAVTINDNINYIDLDSYLLGVVAGEMPAEFEMEALKAQVVASRTFVYNRNLSVDNTTNSQVYLSEEKMKENWKDKYNEFHEKIKKAIDETNNEVMKYDGQYISALFFSSSNGSSENVEDYFASSALPYLRSVDSHWDLEIDPKNKREKTFTKKQLQELFSCQNLDFNIIAYKKSGRIETLRVGNKDYTGRQVREILQLASSCFSINREGNNYTFITLGSGHGVGMSQYGAQAMALQGSNYKDILNHYYTNIEIVNS